MGEVPWAKLCTLTEPVYPKGEGAGRPTVGLERMLRIYFLQEWFNLSAVEESLYDSASMRQFVGINAYVVRYNRTVRYDWLA